MADWPNLVAMGIKPLSTKIQYLPSVVYLSVEKVTLINDQGRSFATQITAKGSPESTMIVQYRVSPDTPWETLIEITLDDEGLGSVTDNRNAPSMFYRSVTPQD